MKPAKSVCRGGDFSRITCLKKVVPKTGGGATPGEGILFYWQTLKNSIISTGQGGKGEWGE